MEDPNAVAAQATPAAATTPTDGTPAAATPAATPDEWYLDLGDGRTRYKTRDDAVTGVRKASERITQLTPYGEYFDRLGKEFNRPVTVEEVDQWLSDYDALLKKQAGGSAADPKSHFDWLRANAPQQWSDAIAWLEAQTAAKGSGAAGAQAQPTTSQSADDPRLAEIQAKLDAIERRTVGEEQARIEAARQAGQSLVGELVKASNLNLDDKVVAKLGRDIEYDIVEASRDANDNLVPGSPEDRFLKGDAATRRSIVEEFLKPWLGAFGGAAQAGNAAYAQQKAAAKGSQPAPVRPGSQGTPAAPAGNKRLSESELRQNVLTILSQQEQ